MVHYCPEKNSNFAKRFLTGQTYMYSGTEWKLRRTEEQLNRFLFNDIFQGWEHENNVQISEKTLEQIAIPALEPNHLIDQASLIVGKAWEQVVSMMVVLTGQYSGDLQNDVVLPEEVCEEYREKGSVVFLTSDVGVRESMRQGKWIPRRNFYLKGKDLHAESISLDSLAHQLLAYYASPEIYGQLDPDVPCIRAIDSAMALVEVDFSKMRRMGKPFLVPQMPKVTVYPTNSTVGVLFPSHPLSSDRGRKEFLEYMLENGKREGIDGKSVLRDMNGRAGGFKTEDGYHFASRQGVSVLLMAGSKDSSEGLSFCQEEDRLIQHVEGIPYSLLRETLLTLLTTPSAILNAIVVDDPSQIPCAEFAKQQYPEGLSKTLSVYGS